MPYAGGGKPLLIFSALQLSTSAQYRSISLHANKSQHIKWIHKHCTGLCNIFTANTHWKTLLFYWHVEEEPFSGARTGKKHKSHVNLCSLSLKPHSCKSIEGFSLYSPHFFSLCAALQVFNTPFTQTEVMETKFFFTCHRALNYGLCMNLKNVWGDQSKSNVG